MAEAESDKSASVLQAVAIALLFFSTIVSGCGAILTCASHSKYSECVETCKSRGDRLARRTCEDNCYSNFDWSQSPLVDYDDTAPRQLERNRDKWEPYAIFVK
jgi:hypothetical protein